MAKKSLSVKDMNGQKIINVLDGTSAQDAATKAMTDAAAAFGASLANRGATTTDHTAINDFDTAVRLNRIDQMAAPTASVAFGSQKITGLADPTNPQEGATKNYVDTQLAGQASGLQFKGSVRAVSTANITIATPGATIDGITAATNDVFLLAGQSTGAQNGPYVWTGAATPLTRATNWDASGEAVLGSFWVVREGSQADKFAIMTNDTFTFNTTTATFTYVGATPPASGFTENTPGGGISGGGSWVITHSLNTRGVSVTVIRNSSPWDEVEVAVEHTSVNVVTIKPDIAMAAAEYTAYIGKII